ncbi:hypothetical protein [Algoriphagus terrigena]|uniref:hypothetical protein n=1 Tax=Algoriphagus terrigena TaxID=344884 RepID=UPI000413C761|nr:hypothetical protein [Algoriphagus terrigena]
MPLKVPIEGSSDFSEFSFSHFEQNGSNYFVLNNDDGSGEQIRIEFPFSIDKIPLDYTVSLFAFRNIYYSQSDLIELRLHEKVAESGRIGYIYLLSALVDRENSNFNKHTIPYVYLTYLKLITGINPFKEIIPTTQSDIYKISDFYNDDLVITAICDQLVVDVIDFSFDDYLYLFYTHGFIYVEDVLTTTNYNPIPFVKENFESIKESLYNGRYSWKIIGASKTLRSEVYPSVLIKRLISEKHYFLSKFHILYQVIELLISDVLKNEIMLTFNNLDNEVSGQKIKETFSMLATEGYRIKLLINSYCKHTIGFDTVMIEKINHFFSEIRVNLPESDGDSVSNKLSSLIYKHRNNLVHNYRVIHQEGDRVNMYLVLLDELNSYFEYLIFEILHSYKRRLSISEIETTTV